MLQVEVYIQPPPPEVLRGRAVAVLDILRATTVHAALFAGGVRAVYPVADFAGGVRLRDALGGAAGRVRLIGEIDSLPPPEADYGNSPTEYTRMDVRDWTLVHVTGNGTGALLRAREAPLALSGCLRNRSVVCAALAEAAQSGAGRIAIVCSGDHGGAAPSLEDTFAAGAYVSRLLQAAETELAGGALTALAVYERYAGDAAAAFADSPHGRHLMGLGFERDLVYAGEVDEVGSDAEVIGLELDASVRPRLTVMRKR